MAMGLPRFCAARHSAGVQQTGWTRAGRPAGDGAEDDGALQGKPSPETTYPDPGGVHQGQLFAPAATDDGIDRLHAPVPGPGSEASPVPRVPELVQRIIPSSCNDSLQVDPPPQAAGWPKALCAMGLKQRPVQAPPLPLLRRGVSSPDPHESGFHPMEET
jgi:hypothetical protein